MAASTANLPTLERASFLAEIQEAYNLRRKSLLLLTGDIHGAQDAAGLTPGSIRELLEVASRTVDSSNIAAQLAFSNASGSPFSPVAARYRSTAF